MSLLEILLNTKSIECIQAEWLVSSQYERVRAHFNIFFHVHVASNNNTTPFFQNDRYVTNGCFCEC